MQPPFLNAETLYLKGACHKAMMAATASLTTRLPCSLLPFPLSVMMASLAGRTDASFTVTKYRRRMSQQNRLSMATPAVMACRLISARAGREVFSSQCCCAKWPSDREILKSESACSRSQPKGKGLNLGGFGILFAFAP